MTLGYLCAVFIALIFMLYMSGDVGVLMLSFLLLMPLLSLIMTLLVRRSVTLEFRLPDTARKQQSVTAVIVLRKRSVLPVPFLRMRLIADAHFEPLSPDAEPLPEQPQPTGIALYDNSVLRRRKKLLRNCLTPDMLPLCLSMGTEKEKEYRITLRGRFCGSGGIALERITLSDYLAMFRFPVRETHTANLLITPDIPEQSANSELFRTVTTAINAAETESEAEPTFSASSVPGYEHRDYIAGDSLRRINWKLSTKRHKLMVRQDEPVALARLSVVLDFRRDTRALPPVTRLAHEEHLVEAALGFLTLCARNGYPCTLYYADQADTWCRTEIDDAGALPAAAITILRGGFRPYGARSALSALPPALTADPDTVVLFFTANTGAQTAEAMDLLPNALSLIVPEDDAVLFPKRRETTVWLVSTDRQIKKQIL